MPLCQLIHKEVQKISGTQIDTNYLDPREYDKVMEQIPKEIEKLEILQKILNLSSESLAIIDEYSGVNGINVKSLGLKELCANNIDEISDTTVFYLNNLNYQEYEILRPEAKSLPDNLKVIFGKFLAERTNIEKIDLQFVGDSALLNDNSNLVTADIKIVMKNFWVHECDSIFSINNQEVKSSVAIYSNPKLTTAIIGNVGGDLKIQHNHEMANLKFGNVAGEAGLYDNISLGEIYMGNVMGVLSLTKGSVIKAKNIHSIHDRKISVGQLFIREESSFDIIKNDPLKEIFHINGNI